MKQFFIYYIFLVIFISGCKGQPNSKPQTLYNPEFKWTIVIPDNFTSVSPDEWTKLQNKGTDAIEKTYGAEVVNQSKTIFVFKSGDFNYLEANHQPFDPAIDGDYLESNKLVGEILYETFRAQMPDAKIDTAHSVEKISGLEFQAFKVYIDMPNGMKFTSWLFSRLFDKKEFSVNVMFVDEEKGNKMLESWRNCKFE